MEENKRRWEQAMAEAQANTKNGWLLRTQPLLVILSRVVWYCVGTLGGGLIAYALVVSLLLGHDPIAACILGLLGVELLMTVWLREARYFVGALVLALIGFSLVLLLL